MRGERGIQVFRILYLIQDHKDPSWCNFSQVDQEELFKHLLNVILVECITILVNLKNILTI